MAGYVRGPSRESVVAEAIRLRKAGKVTCYSAGHETSLKQYQRFQSPDAFGPSADQETRARGGRGVAGAGGEWTARTRGGVCAWGPGV